MAKKEKIKKKKNHRGRHKFFWWILRPLVTLFVKIKFGYRRKVAKNLPKNYIVISNHTTDYDPLFVATSFKKQMYFVASEHITRWKTAFKFLNYVFEPIIRYKGASASSTIMEMLRKSRNGDNVCIFAEGVRSWSGENSPVSFSTAKMVKSAKCGLVTYRISGGYLASPNWATGGTRHGKVWGEPVNVYTAEEIEKMTNEELYEHIVNDIYENAYDTQDKFNYKYKGKNLAKGIENVAFICPECGEHDSLYSEGNDIKCSKCGNTFSYNVYGNFDNCKFKNVNELYKWQLKKLKKDVEKNVAYVVNDATISSVNLDHSKQELSQGRLEMNCDKMICGDKEINMCDITDMAIFGKRGLMLSCGKDYYEVRVTSGNALKYLLYYNQYSEMKTDEK